MRLQQSEVLQGADADVAPTELELDSKQEEGGEKNGWKTSTNMYYFHVF